MADSRFRALFSFVKKEIDWAFKRARRIARGGGLTLLQNPGLFSEGEGGDQQVSCHGKLLIIVPRRAGKAHKRNLLRRRMRSVFYEHELFKKPVTSILIVGPQAMELSFEQLRDFLIGHLDSSTR